jgi:uncharacterized membrane protein
VALFGSTLPFFNHTGCDSHTAGCHPNPLFYFVYLSELLAPTTQLRQAAPPLTVFSLNHLLFLVGIALTVIWAKRGRLPRADWAVMLLWFLVPLLLLSTRELKFPRYLFIWAMPCVAIFTAVGVVFLGRKLPSKARSWATALLALILILAPQVDLRLRDIRQGLWRYVKSDILEAPTDNFEKLRWQTEQLTARMGPDDTVVSSFDDAGLKYYLGRHVYGFVSSIRTDDFFNQLLDTAEEEGHRVWFADSLPALNFCIASPEDPRDIDCRKKYKRFYDRCTGSISRSPACAHLKVDI